jgi:capsular polysaccharide biosynthesis protein
MIILRALPSVRAAFLKAFVLVFIGAIACGNLVIAFWPPVYKSTVRIEVQKSVPEESRLKPAAVFNGNSDPYFMTTQSKIIESYSILTNVITVLHLDEKLPEQLGKQRWTVDETYVYLSKLITVEQTRMPSLLEVTVKNLHPQWAANIANAIATSYRAALLKQWRETNSRASWEEPATALAIVRDPARPEHRLGLRGSRAFLMWMLWGTLLALVAGGAAAAFADTRSRFGGGEGAG